MRLYGNYNGKVRTVCNVSVFPIYGCKTKPPMNFSQEICNYTEQGRIAIHSKLRGYSYLIKYLLETVNNSKSAEFNDNRISLIVGQKGKCYITGLDLETDNMECHHKMLKSKGGSDKYENLVWLCGEAHKLVHAIEQDVIKKYLGLLSLDKKGLKRVNSLRMLVGNSVI
ncbi:HNH endonuclease [Clostridium butyricum]|nr:HNH endonuclease [Clostridium butyricum]